MNRAVLLGVGVALASCGQQSKQYQAITFKAGIAEPGAYEEKTTTRIEAPGVQPRIKEDSDRHCLKGGEDPVRHELTEKLDRLCVGSTLRFEDGVINGEAECLWSSGATERMRVNFSGSYDRDRVEFVSESTVPGGSVRQTRIFERTGNCLSTAEAVDDAIAHNDWSIAENQEAIP